MPGPQGLKQDTGTMPGSVMNRNTRSSKSLLKDHGRTLKKKYASQPSCEVRERIMAQRSAESKHVKLARFTRAPNRA